jgi:hypothetical protein
MMDRLRILLSISTCAATFWLRRASNTTNRFIFIFVDALEAGAYTRPLSELNLSHFGQFAVLCPVWNKSLVS